MAVQLKIPYETFLELVDQLPPEQQQDLLLRLLEKKQNFQLSKDERKKLFHSMIVNLGEVSPDYSDHRADWYGDDGR